MTDEQKGHAPFQISFDVLFTPQRWNRSRLMLPPNFDWLRLFGFSHQSNNFCGNSSLASTFPNHAAAI